MGLNCSVITVSPWLCLTLASVQVAIAGAGMLLAIAAAQQAAAPAIMCLRGMNPYVDAALTDWSRRGGGSQPLVPRGAAPAAALSEAGSLAGDTTGHGTILLTIDWNAP